MEEWLKLHGTESLLRAQREGYDVDKGVSDLLLEDLASDTRLHVIRRWDEIGERTSPRAESFARRDLVKSAAAVLDVPPGWQLEVSRISRATLPDGSFLTGVLVEAWDEDRRSISSRFFSFEGGR